MTDEVEKIAAGLSEAQKRAIANRDLDSLTSQDWDNLCRAGCAWYRAADIDLESGDHRLARRELRSRGRAVAQHIKETT
jgi:hypothetical protein